MPSSVRTIRLGITNSYLVGAKRRWILVDAGSRGHAAVFFRKLGAAGGRPTDIRLIVITHAHFDHVGSLAAIGRRCHCPVAIHKAEAGLLARGQVVLPPGTRPATRMLLRLARRHPRIVSRWYRFRPVTADIRIDEEFTLQGFGVAARIVHTPGHTAGSLSVLTDAGDAVVGDLAVNYYPFGLGPIAPPFGDSLVIVRQQWRRLLELGARRIYPAHGWPFPADRLRQMDRVQTAVRH